MWSAIVRAIWGESPVEVASREVLVIDPSATRRRALADALRGASIPVVELRSHTEAMARISAGLKPILAVAGADRGGVELAAELRADAANDDVRLLLLAPVAHLSLALGAGADACVQEPISESALVARIQELAN